jgi:hypothetical protein
MTYALLTLGFLALLILISAPMVVGNRKWYSCPICGAYHSNCGDILLTPPSECENAMGSVDGLPTMVCPDCESSRRVGHI